MKNIYKAMVMVLAINMVTMQTRAATKESKAPVVQIALLLDTSNSMDGLINQAKGQLWKIVNEFISAKQDGKRPELQVALYEYGKATLSASRGYIRQIQPFTTDLDKLSEELFALKTNGGDEYCGWVIRDAVRNLAWSQSSDDYKAIFIAGNEPFSQGPVKFADSCKEAITKGILVNTIHCGDERTGTSSGWRDGALLAEGKFMFIDHERAVVHFEAPQDKEIARLGVELNKTYIGYGALGREGLARQAKQDENASSLSSSGSSVSRALSKSSYNYDNGKWDLVDGYNSKKVDLEKLKASDLPVEMQKMSAVERKEFVEAKNKERTNIQKQIQTLNEQRSKFIADKAKEQGQASSLDSVIVGAIREQAAKRNYQFGK